MEKETITITKEEYEKLKEMEESLKNLDLDLIRQFKEGLEDVKAGRIRRVA